MSSRSRSKGRAGNIRLDSGKFEQARLRVGLSPKELFLKAKIAEKTGYCAARGEKIRVATARQLAETLGIDDLTDLMASEEVVLENDFGLPAEWEAVNSETDWISSSNGLQYRVYRLSHRKLPNETARGKLFDLDNVAFERAGQFRDALVIRHAQVCRALNPSGYFLVNQAVVESGDKRFLWVVDTWPAGESLSLLQQQDRIATQRIPSIMLHVACALHELHQHNIVLRDLRPETIFYDIETDRLSIVDCELAKLLDGSPTVVLGELVESPYRAPECIGHKIDQTVDLYSWTQLLLYLWTGREPSMEAEPEALATIGLPPTLLPLAQSCLSTDFRNRPESFTVLMPKIKKWVKR